MSQEIIENTFEVEHTEKIIEATNLLKKVWNFTKHKNRDTETLKTILKELNFIISENKRC